MEGRVRGGFSGGGKAYGYRVVRSSDGEERGRREIDPEEAAVVREIFERFAKGEGPRSIAQSLNARCIHGVSEKPWVGTTIRGHAKKGTGILNNQLYGGRQIWNRMRYVHDPQARKRVSRMNPQSEWIVMEAPNLRIVSDELGTQLSNVRPRLAEYAPIRSRQIL